MVTTKTEAEQVDALTKIVKLVEDGSEKLRGEAFDMAIGIGSNSKQDIAMTLAMKLAAIRNLAWAFRTFPQFDLNALSITREMEVEVSSGYGHQETKSKRKLMLPVFAVNEYCGLSSGRIGGVRLYVSKTGHVEQSIGDRRISYSEESANYNRLAMHEVDSAVLNANQPIAPLAVRNRVADISSRFSRLHLAWETSWNDVPKPDPLVIGEIDGHFFLVDQFDTTKLEGYVVSEFSVKRG